MKLKLSVCHRAPQDQTVNAHCFPLVTLHDSAHAYVAIGINDLEQGAVHPSYSYLWFWPLPRNRNVSEGSNFARLNPSRKWQQFFCGH